MTRQVEWPEEALHNLHIRTEVAPDPHPWTRPMPEHRNDGCWYLYHDGIPYTLIVFKDDRGKPEWDVDIFAEHVTPGHSDNWDFYLGAATLDRVTHIVDDMWDHVATALAERVRDEKDGLVDRRVIT